MRLAFVVVFVCAWLTSGALAQAGEPWLIVPVTSTPQDDWMQSTASRLRTELLEQGIEVWSLEQASRDFEAKMSGPALEIAAADLDAWASDSSAAIGALALGDYETALTRLEEALRLSRRSGEELNRQRTRAQQALDTCLYAVRVFVETDRKAQARARARECRVLVPGVEASESMHPPWVIELLREVDASRAQQSGALRVDSEPSGCTARLNGVVVGETPVEITQLFPGQYRVQIECDPERRGRVHLVEVGSRTEALLVDPRFDRVVESRPLVHLRYASAADETRYRISDVARIASALPSSAVLLVSMPRPDVIELELIDPEGLQPDSEPGATLDRSGPAAPGIGALALARIPAGSRGPSRGDLALSARALAAHQCTDFTGPRPTALACGRPTDAPDAPSEPTQRAPTKKRPRGQLISGLTLFGLGASSLITSAVLFSPRSATSVDWYNDVEASTGSTANQSRWLSLNQSIYFTAAAGGGLLVAAMPMALPNHDKTPWWAWVSGGAGIGLAAFAIAYGVTAEPEPTTSCSSDGVDVDDVRSCVVRAERVSGAVLAGAIAAPLLTLPLVYLLRRSPTRVEPTVELGPRGAFAAVRGRF
jgi:hypothetical protein